MKLMINREPCLLMEAMELVYAWINEIPVEAMTAATEFSIPPEELRHIRDEVCADLSKEDEVVQFYFRGIPMGNRSNRDGFMAGWIFYSNIFNTCGDMDQMARSLSEQWATKKRPYVLNSYNAYAIPVESGKDEDFQSLAKGVAKMPIPAEFQCRLIEVVYNYDYYLNRLVELMRPVVERLKPLLEPWVCRAEPLLQQWEDFLHSEEGEVFLNTGLSLDRSGWNSLSLTLRYCSGNDCYVRSYNRMGHICLIPGVNMGVGLTKPQPESMLLEDELAALRLLGNADRMAMLRSLTRSPKTCQELIEELDLNSGTVFRSLNNMVEIQLLNREFCDGKTIYRTNPEVLRNLSARLLQVSGVGR